MSIEPRSRRTSSAEYSRVIPSQREFCFQSRSISRLRIASPLLQPQQLLVGRNSQKIFELIAERQPVEQSNSAANERPLADRLPLFVTDFFVQVGGHRTLVIEPRAVMDPLPQLRARNLGGRGVFH